MPSSKLCTLGSEPHCGLYRVERRHRERAGPRASGHCPPGLGGESRGGLMGSCGSHSCWELCRRRYKVFTKERIRFLSQPTMPDDEAGGGSPVREQRDPGLRGRGRGLPTAWYLRTQDGATEARPAPRMGVRTPGDGPAGRAQAPAAPRDSGRRDSSSATSPPWPLKFSGLSVWGESSRADKSHRQLLPFRRLTHRQHTGLPTEHP